MEEYKQHLCICFNIDCKSEDTIYEHIKSNPQYRYRLNEEGKLHSNYMGSYYEPAIIRASGRFASLYWLFNGEIKDCNHPFCITLMCGKVSRIEYYSSERIREGQPISISYTDKTALTKTYNRYSNWYSGNTTKVLDDFEDFNHVVKHEEYLDEQLFTSEFYPLCDPLDSYHLKFAD